MILLFLFRVSISTEHLNAIIHSISIHFPTKRSTMMMGFDIMRTTGFVTSPRTAGSTTASLRKTSALILVKAYHIAYLKAYRIHCSIFSMVNDSQWYQSEIYIQLLCLCYLKELDINRRLHLVCITVGQHKWITKFH